MASPALSGSAAVAGTISITRAIVNRRRNNPDPAIHAWLPKSGFHLPRLQAIISRDR